MDHKNKKPANTGYKKRDNKALDKKHAGTVEFADRTFDKKKSQSKSFSDNKKDFSKGPNKFQKTDKAGASKTPYANRNPNSKDGSVSKSFDKTDRTGSQIRREKSKTSDLKKKLMLHYNKLIMKKKDIGMDNKADIVAESVKLIGTNFEDLIFKHDGCRIIQQLIKHGSMKQKEAIIEQIKPHAIKLMTQKYSNHLAQKAFYYSPSAA